MTGLSTGQRLPDFELSDDATIADRPGEEEVLSALGAVGRSERRA